MSVTLNGSALDVQINGTYHHVQALGFNVVGPREGLTISNLSTGYSIGPTDVPGTFGFFEYFVTGPGYPGGPPGSFETGPLTFTLTREGGFLSPLDVFEMNEFGFLAGGLFLGNPFGALYGFATEVAAVDAPAPVPEPGTMLLLGTGLLAAYRARRRQT